MPAMNPRSAVGLAQAVGDGLAHSQRGFRCDNVVFCGVADLTTWGFRNAKSSKHNIVTCEASEGWCQLGYEAVKLLSRGNAGGVPDGVDGDAR